MSELNISLIFSESLLNQGMKKKKKTDMMNLRAQVLCLKKFLNIDTAV